MSDTPQYARDLLVAALGHDPFDGVEALMLAGERRARAEGNAYALDHGRKIVLARIMTEIEKAHDGPKLSEVKLERLARADVRYADHVKKTARAMEEKEMAASAYFGKKAELEWDGHASFAWNAAAKLAK